MFCFIKVYKSLSSLKNSIWIFSLLLMGCSQSEVELVKKNVSSFSQSGFCIVDPLEVEGGAVKLLFVIDNSGSNLINDPVYKRIDHINDFVSRLSRKEQTYQYGMIVFNHGYDGLLTDEFTEDVDRIYDLGHGIKNGSYTYLEGGGTFTLAERLIKDDMNRSSDNNKYIILFISDGRVGEHLVSLASGLVDRMDNVYVSSAYYGPTDPNAIQLLQNMAQDGKGSFANFEEGESWNLDTLLLTGKPDVIPWSLKEFLVYNLNAGFCFDGRVDVDSDADGMCDRDELEANRIYAEELRAEGKLFDPANRFSFVDGYGDFFHWLRFKYPGKTLPPCTDRSDDDHDLLTVCEENEIKHRTEDGILRGNPEFFDTDKDGIIDGIETFVYFPSNNTGIATRYTAALEPENLEDSPDGEDSVLVQIKEHRNPWYKDYGITEAYDTNLVPLKNHKNDCYEFNQSSLPLYETLEVKEGDTLAGLEHTAGENSVMVYYIQVLQTSPGDQGVLQHTVQKISGSSSQNLNGGLRVSQEIFNQYIPPKE